MNIHPSLLPKFAGGMDKDVHQAVLDAKEKVTGCTLHFVDESVDGGPIIMQKEVKINKNETAGTLREKVQKAEQEIIIKAIKLYSEGKIRVKVKNFRFRLKQFNKSSFFWENGEIFNTLPPEGAMNDSQK